MRTENISKDVYSAFLDLIRGKRDIVRIHSTAWAVRTEYIFKFGSAEVNIYLGGKMIKCIEYRTRMWNNSKENLSEPHDEVMHVEFENESDIERVDFTVCNGRFVLDEGGID